MLLPGQPNMHEVKCAPGRSDSGARTDRAEGALALDVDRRLDRTDSLGLFPRARIVIFLASRPPRMARLARGVMPTQVGVVHRAALSETVCMLGSEVQWK